MILTGHNMKNKKTILLSIFFSIVFLSTTCSATLTTNDETSILIDVIIIDDDNTAGPWDGTVDHPYVTISDGINNAKNGDILYVLNGTYNEQIEIDKNLQIIGEDKNNTIINGEYQDDVIKVLSENVYLDGFTIKNSKGENENAGIKILSNNVTISDCKIYRTRYGIALYISSNLKIIGCLIHTNGGGVLLDECKNCEITDSEFCHNAIGINIKKSQEINIKKSYIHEHGIGIFINDSENIKLTDIALCDNNNNQGGCFIFNSKEIEFYNANVIHNGLAIRIDESKDIKIEKSTFRYNAHNCIYLKRNVSSVTITKCDIYENLRYGVHVNKGECTVEYNNFYDNWIDSCHVKKGGVCNARFNYWGSMLGPLTANGVKVIDLFRIIENGRIKLVPWRITPVKNTGADWNVEDSFTKTEISGYGDENIQLSGNDTDCDGVPDWWETEFGYDPLVYDDHANIDEDKDALNNFEECYTYEYGSSPFIKDVFLEIDWIETARTSGVNNLPDEEDINSMKARFAVHYINLHVDIGQLDGGEKIPYQPRFNFDVLVDIYWDYFLHNNLSNPRKNIFHYALVCDQGPSTGFEFMGWAHCNALCISSEILKLVYPTYTYKKLIIKGIMHELGHTFGLFSDDFGGNDNRAAVEPFYLDYYIYHNYKSIMNYRYFLTILDYSDGDNGRVDFNDWANLDFEFFKNTHFEWPLD